jgi:hypothetical protein
MVPVLVGLLSGVMGPIYRRSAMGQEKSAVFEGTILVTVFGKEGETGQIVECNRDTCDTWPHLAEVIADNLVRQVQRIWPPTLTSRELRRTPSSMVVSIEIKRKEAKLYGN